MNFDINNEIELEIPDLEYDVAGAGAAEAGDTQASNLAFLIVMFDHT